MGTGTTKEGARAAGRGVPVSTPPHLAPKGMLAPGFGVMSAFLWGVHVGGGLLGRRVCMCSYSFNSHSHPRPVRVLVPSLPWQGLAVTRHDAAWAMPWVSGCWTALPILRLPAVMVS